MLQSDLKHRNSEFLNNKKLYFGLCALFSFVAQIAIIINSQTGALINGAGLETLFTWIAESPPLVAASANFLTVFLALHLLFYAILYQIYRLATERLPGEGRSLLYISLFHILAFLVLLIINAQLYPRSLFAWAVQPVLEQSNSELKLGILLTLFGLLCLLALWRFIQRLTTLSWTKKWFVTMAIAGGLSYQIVVSRHHDSIAPASRFPQPNVILIGIDSLRPDLITEQLTPNMAAVAQTSAVFSNAYSPLGRTFPAWVSILTGKYPTRHGARFNLTATDQLDLKNTLGKDLQQRGYATAFFMDEKRFANIDQSYGFDIVKGPEIGLRDFLLGSIADFPVLNLLRQLPLGKQLLPDSYDNRAVSNLYEPGKFDHLLGKTLAELKSRPLFLAVHFCLPHWPYTWADIDRYPTPASPIGFPLDDNYLKAVHRADRQVGQLLSRLESEGFLQNAIVIFLSDHPESFTGEPAISAYDVAKGDISLSSSWGHGMSVVRPDQSKILLMIRKYGKHGIVSKELTSPASLIDIRPTILNMLDIDHADTIDGLPLLAKGQVPKLDSRPIFLETGLALSHMKSATIDKARLIKDGVEYYDIDPSTGRLVLKKEHYENLVGKKSRAVMKDGWLLSISPIKEPGKDAKTRVTLAQLGGRAPSADEVPKVISKLLPLLCEHFHNDRAFAGGCSIPTDKSGDKLAGQ